MIISLTVVLSIIISVAYIMPALSPAKTLGIVVGMVIFLISFVSTEIGLYILIHHRQAQGAFLVYGGHGHPDSTAQRGESQGAIDKRAAS